MKDHAKTTDINLQINEITFTDQETVLTETNILFLKRMFKNPERYRYYMKVLWILRSLLARKCALEGDVNTKDEAYPIYKVANELIGCLLQDDTFFDSEGNLVTRFEPDSFKM